MPKNKSKSQAQAPAAKAAPPALADTGKNKGKGKAVPHEDDRSSSTSSSSSSSSSYGSDSDSDSDSESDETEDEDGEQVTADVDAAILRTLAKIKRKDGDIYEPNQRIYENEHSKLSTIPVPQGAARGSGASKGKRVTLQDYQRSRIEEALAFAAAAPGGDTDAAARRLAEATTNPARLGHVVDYDAPARDGVRTYAQEEEELRREVLDAFHADDDDSDAAEDGDDGFLRKKEGPGAADEEGKSYREYLLEALGGDEQAVREVIRERAEEAAQQGIIVPEPESNGVEEEGESDKKKKRKDKGKDKAAQGAQAKSQEEKDQEFLMNYILNQGWREGGGAAAGGASSSRKRSKADASAGADGSAGGSGERDWEAEAAELSSEASFDSRASAFETAYNFRYEAVEAGAAPAAVHSFSRDAAAVGSVRRDEKKERRREKREERRKRKEEEKKGKMKALEKAKEKKSREILERLKQLKEATGSDAIDLAALDLEAEFDPTAHDRAMQSAFNDRYYAEQDEQLDADGKPVWNDDIDIGDIPEYHGEDGMGAVWNAAPEGDEDGPIEMDADFVDGGASAGAGAQQPDLSKLSKKERKKLKKKEKKAAQKAGAADGEEGDDAGVDEQEMDAEQLERDRQEEEAFKKLPPEQRKKKVSEILDQVYNMDYEDMIGDLPTRFKYIQVPKSTYGMTPVEILMADDAQLNQVVGIKQMQPYRRGPKRPADLGRKLHEFRRQLNANNSSGSQNKGKGKAKADAGADADASAPAQPTAEEAKIAAAWSTAPAPPKKRKRLGKHEREKLAKREQGDGGAPAGAPADDAPAAAAAGSASAKAADEKPKKRAKTQA